MVSKYYDKDYDIFAEAARILSSPEDTQTEYEELLDNQELLHNRTSHTVHDYKDAYREILKSLQESEGRLIDHISYIKDLRRSLSLCKSQLQSQSINYSGIINKKVYLKHMIRGLKDTLAIISSQEDVENLIKGKLHERACELINKSLYKFNNFQFNQMNIFSLYKHKISKLEDDISIKLLKHLKSILFMRKHDFKVRKYFTMGIINIHYLVNTSEYETKKEIIRILNSLDYVKSLDKITTLDVNSELSSLFLDCLSQLASSESFTNTTTNSVDSLFPLTAVTNTITKTCNALVAIVSLVLKNYNMLIKCLKGYSHKLSIQPIFYVLQSELIEILKSLALIPNSEGRNSVSVDLIVTEISKSQYSNIIERIVSISPYNYPCIYPLMKQYLPMFAQSTKSTELVVDLLQEFLEDHLFKFLETVRLDMCNLFASYMSNPEYFRGPKTRGYVYIASERLITNVEVLKDLASVFSDHSSTLMMILASVLSMYVTNIKKVFANCVEHSHFHNNILTNNAFFYDMRSDSDFESSRLAVPEEYSDLFHKLYSGENIENRGLYRSVREKMVSFNHPPLEMYIKDPTKYRKIATIVLNLELVFPRVLSFASDFDESALDSSMFYAAENSFSFNKKSIHEVSIDMAPTELTAHTFTQSLIDIQEIHDKSLLVVRGELESMVYLYMQNLKADNYWKKTLASRDYSYELVTEIKHVYLDTHKVLNFTKTGFVFQAAIECIASMLIFGLGEVKDRSFSSEGITRYLKNAKVIENELMVLELPGFPQKNIFKRLNAFFKMLDMDEKAMKAYVVQSNRAFSKAELQVTAGLKVPKRPDGISSHTLQELELNN